MCLYTCLYKRTCLASEERPWITQVSDVSLSLSLSLCVCVCVCMYMYMYMICTHAHNHTYTNIHTHTHTYTHIHTHTRLRACARAHTHAHTHDSPPRGRWGHREGSHHCTQVCFQRLHPINLYCHTSRSPLPYKFAFWHMNRSLLPYAEVSFAIWIGLFCHTNRSLLSCEQVCFWHLCTLPTTAPSVCPNCLLPYE